MSMDLFYKVGDLEARIKATLIENAGADAKPLRVAGQMIADFGIDFTGRGADEDLALLRLLDLIANILAIGPARVTTARAIEELHGLDPGIASDAFARLEADGTIQEGLHFTRDQDGVTWIRPYGHEELAQCWISPISQLIDQARRARDSIQEKREQDLDPADWWKRARANRQGGKHEDL